MNAPYTRGFTFLETLVVMGIFVVVGGFALFVSMETYRSSSFRSDRDLLVAALQHARAQAVNNICLGTCTDGKPHGVHIQADKYILFQGNAYDAGDPMNAAFESSLLSAKNPPELDIVFRQLSGNTGCSPACDISLTQGSQVSVISVTGEGRISWTN